MDPVSDSQSEVSAQSSSIFAPSAGQSVAKKIWRQNDLRLCVLFFVLCSLLSCLSNFSVLADLVCQFRVQMAAGLFFFNFFDFVNQLKPDVICLEEYSEGWFENLSTGQSAIKTNYPFQISNIRDDNFGIAIFSRYPLKDASIQVLGRDRLPSAFARVQVNGTLWSIMATHPPPPLSTELYDLRNQQFMVMADFIKSQAGNFVLAGDLNSAPWSAHFLIL